MWLWISDNSLNPMSQSLHSFFSFTLSLTSVFLYAIVFLVRFLLFQMWNCSFCWFWQEVDSFTCISQFIRVYRIKCIFLMCGPPSAFTLLSCRQRDFEGNVMVKVNLVWWKWDEMEGLLKEFKDIIPVWIKALEKGGKVNISGCTSSSFSKKKLLYCTQNYRFSFN